MVPDRVVFSEHSREKISEICQMAGVPNISVDWVYGRVLHLDGDLFRKASTPRYELFCPDKGDIAIQYQVEIRGTDKVAVIVTVMIVSDPYGRYRGNGQWQEVVDA